MWQGLPVGGRCAQAGGRAGRRAGRQGLTSSLTHQVIQQKAQEARVRLLPESTMMEVATAAAISQSTHQTPSSTAETFPRICSSSSSSREVGDQQIRAVSRRQGGQGSCAAPASNGGGAPNA